MRLVTNDGIFLSGDPFELVVQLGARVRVPVGHGLDVSRAQMLLLLECDRIARFYSEVGPQFATFAATHLLLDLEEEGLILVCH